MGIEKVNKINFLKGEVEKLKGRWSQNWVNIRSPSYLKQKSIEYCLRGKNRLCIQFSFELGDVLLF